MNKNELIQIIEELKPWHQKLDFGDGIVSPGKWDPKAQFNMLQTHIHSSLNGLNVIDVGANAGGIAFEFAKRGASVTAIEIGSKYIDQARLYKQVMGVESVNIVQGSLFELHKRPGCDLLLLLGLVYHFRHPQLFLDYAANLDFSHAIISTQTLSGTSLTMQNRAVKYQQNRYMGWEPTPEMFIRMLESAGFQNIKHVPTQGLEFTNNSYFFVSKDKGQPINLDAVATLCTHAYNWT